MIFIGITVLIQINKIGGFIKEKIASFAEDSGMQLWVNGLIVVGIFVVLNVLLNFMVKKF